MIMNVTALHTSFHAIGRLTIVRYRLDVARISGRLDGRKMINDEARMTKGNLCVLGDGSLIGKGCRSTAHAADVNFVIRHSCFVIL